MRESRKETFSAVWHSLMLGGSVSLITGIATAGGSMLGAGIGREVGPELRPPGLFIGAVGGGLAGLLLAVTAARRVGAIPATGASGGGAYLGGLAGFGLAIPLAVAHLHSPVVPLLSSLLPGLGTVVGQQIEAGRAARPERSRRPIGHEQNRP